MSRIRTTRHARQIRQGILLGRTGDTLAALYEAHITGDIIGRLAERAWARTLRR